MAESLSAVRESEIEAEAEAEALRNEAQEGSREGGAKKPPVSLSVSIPADEREPEEGPAPPPAELLHAASVPDLATQIALAEEGRNPLAPEAVQEHLRKKLGKARTAPAASLVAAMDEHRSSMARSPIVMQPSAPTTPMQVPEIAWPTGKKPHPIKLKPEPSPMVSPDPSPPPSPKRRLREAVMGKGPQGHKDSDPEPELPKLEEHVAVS